MVMPKNWNAGGKGMSPSQHPNFADLVEMFNLDTLTQLKAIPVGVRVDGMNARVAQDVAGVTCSSEWTYIAASALTGDDMLVVTPSDTPAAGRWLRRSGGAALIRCPFTFATADAAALLTVPTGCILLPDRFFWEVGTSFTGGSSSAIGVSSAKTGLTTQGDLLGGATGDVLATLAASAAPIFGTIGAKWDALAERRLALVAADILRFDRITSAFTAGAGNVAMTCHILQNAGV